MTDYKLKISLAGLDAMLTGNPPKRLSYVQSIWLEHFQRSGVSPDCQLLLTGPLNCAHSFNMLLWTWRYNTFISCSISAWMDMNNPCGTRVMLMELKRQWIRLNFNRCGYNVNCSESLRLQMCDFQAISFSEGISQCSTRGKIAIATLFVPGK